VLTFTNHQPSPSMGFSRQEYWSGLPLPSPLLIIRKMQIQTTMRHHFIIKMSVIKKTTDNKCWWGGGEKRALVQDWWKYKLLWPQWKTAGDCSLKGLRTVLPSDPAIPLLDMYPKETNHYLREVFVLSYS